MKDIVIRIRPGEGAAANFMMVRAWLSTRLWWLGRVRLAPGTGPAEFPIQRNGKTIATATITFEDPPHGN